MACSVRQNLPKFKGPRPQPEQTSRSCPTIASVQDRPPRPPRAETREIVELKQLKLAQPELASAIDMQLALVEMQRRVQGRVPLPRIAVDPAWARAQQAAGRPLVRFSDNRIGSDFN